MKTRTLMGLVGAGVALAGGLAAWNDGHFASWGHWATHWMSSADSRYTELQFRSELLDQVNAARGAEHLLLLEVDPLLEAALESEISALKVGGVNAVSARLQDAMPRYLRLSVCAANGPTLLALQDEFRDFAAKVQPEMTHFACTVRESAGGFGQHVLLVTGQRLGDFSPEVMSRSDGGTYYSECLHCDHPHTVPVSRQQHTLGLECPSCRRTYAVVAADEAGRFRYVNEFLTGYAPPADFSKEQSRLHELFTIWTAVHANCTYSRDPGERRNETDNWQTSLETQRLGQGDCEDSSIFLCDWLLARGFQARVALGRYGDMGGHAWCLVKLEGKEYLLESTEGRPDPANPPLVARVGSRYMPEVLFDRFAIYVRSNPDETWGGDYWSTDTWTRVEPRRLRPGASRLPGTLQRADAIQSDPSRRARVTTPHAALAPFTELEEVPADAEIWQVPLPPATMTPAP